jgi:hypothetical protein
MRNTYKILVGISDVNILLGRTLGKQGGKVWTGFFWLRIGTSGEHGNEPSGSIKGGELLDCE